MIVVNVDGDDVVSIARCPKAEDGEDEDEAPSEDMGLLE